MEVTSAFGAIDAAELDRRISPDRPLEESLDAAVEYAHELIGSERCSIMLQKDHRLTIAAARGIPDAVVAETSIPCGAGIAGTVALTGEPMLLDDVDAVGVNPSGAPYPSSRAMVVPLRVGQSKFGVLNFAARAEPFRDEDLARATVVANRVALLVAAQPAKAETRLYASAFDLLRRVSEGVAERCHGDLGSVLNTILEGITDLLGTRRASLMLLEPDGKTLRIRAARGIPEEVVETTRQKVGEGIVGEVVETGEPRLLTNPAAQRSDQGDTENRHYDCLSALAVPLIHDGKILGVLNTNDRIDRREFEGRDLAVATVAASQAAVSIANARLLDESIEAASRRKALEVARSIQRAFLPSPLVHRGTRVTGWSEPADETGGDYIDFFLRGEKLFVACGDVTGHGVGAALIMATCRAFLRAIASGHKSLEEIFTRLNRLMLEETPRNRFVTLFACEIDLRTGEIAYASAGHEPAVLYHFTGPMTKLEATGPPLGLFDHATFEVLLGRIEPGDLLFAGTDGISEAENAAGEMYGRERLETKIRELIYTQADVLARLRENLDRFRGATPVGDDISAVLVEIGES